MNKIFRITILQANGIRKYRKILAEDFQDANHQTDKLVASGVYGLVDKAYNNFIGYKKRKMNHE